MVFAAVMALVSPVRWAAFGWLKPQELVITVCSGASRPYALMRAAICSPVRDIWILYIDRAHTTLLPSSSKHSKCDVVMRDQNITTSGCCPRYARLSLNGGIRPFYVFPIAFSDAP
jgi:hypothetical protein